MELVIVIAIVIILSVVSVPIYRGYTRQAKMSEGYVLLGAIFSAQKNYYSQYGRFLNRRNGSAGENKFTCNDEVLGVNALANKYFTYFSVGCDSDGDGDRLAFNVYMWAVIPESIRNGDKSCLQLYYSVTKSGSAEFSEVKGSF